jgi:hypothetical protein
MLAAEVAMKIRTFFASSALCLLAVSCSCGRDGEVSATSDASEGDALREVPSARPAPGRTAAPSASSHAAARTQALAGAADAVQRYLNLAGTADWKAADALWAYRRQPAAGEEGGFRALMPPRALQIRNGVPRVLDEEAVPAFVEVPVTLRIDGADGRRHRFAGWYRLRANPVEQRWELVAASVAPEIR